MKKLLVLAIATFGAVMAQAGTAVWTVSYDTTEASTWMANGAMAMVFAESAKKTVLELIGTKTGTALQTALEEKTLETSTGTAGSQKVVAHASGTSVNTTDYVQVVLPDNNRVFSMIFSDDTFSGTTDVYWSKVRNAAIEWAIFVSSDFGDPQTIADIKKEQSSLPEPGMLALLALGVAGLALKRKVA